MLDKTKIGDDFILFEENRKLRGYTVKVMEDWGSKIKKRFITEREKQLYQQEFGNQIINDSQFYDWWCRINHLGKYEK